MLLVWPHCRINCRRDSVGEFSLFCYCFFLQAFTWHCHCSSSIHLPLPSNWMRKENLSGRHIFCLTEFAWRAFTLCNGDSSLRVVISSLSDKFAELNCLCFWQYSAESSLKSLSVCFFKALSRELCVGRAETFFLIQIPHSYWKCNYHCRPFVSARRPRLIVSNLSTVFVAKLLPRRCCAERFFALRQCDYSLLSRQRLLSSETTTANETARGIMSSHWIWICSSKL